MRVLLLCACVCFIVVFAILTDYALRFLAL